MIRMSVSDLIWSACRQGRWRLNRPRRALALALWIALLTLGTFAQAEAHMASSLQIAPAVVGEATVVMVAAPVVQHDDGTCPAVPEHPRHQCCIGGASCHAASATIVIITTPDLPGASYEATPSRTIASGDVAPLFHPPKSSIDI
jgi:hypothetical protein